MSPADELSCRELVELVTDYFDGALPAADQRRFEQHLSECAACVLYVLQMRRTITAIGASAVRPDSAGVRDLVEAFRGWKRGVTPGALGGLGEP